MEGTQAKASLPISVRRPDKDQLTSRSMASSHSNHNSIPHSIPRSIPRRPSNVKPASPGSKSTDSSDESLDPKDMNDIVNEHLVQRTDSNFGTMSHSLVGGSITRDIYKWQESRGTNIRQRRNSEPDVLLTHSPLYQSAADMRQPGGFRRHFITHKAKREGKKPPNFLTRNFIDFLVLYGFYGGDVYPSDDEDEESEERPRRRQEVTENSPLLPRQSSTRLNPIIEGTSESKAFFMLVKAFVGTGVLFLPKAFANGGILFSFVAMLFIGYLSKHCMELLVVTSRAFGGKSFGDLGQIIYGDKFRNLVLGSIAFSQMGFCCAYFIFVGQNLRDLLMIVSDCRLILPDYYFILVQIVIYIPLAWVRKIKNFGITSLIADVFIMAALGYIFVYDLTIISDSGPQPVPWMNYQSFPLFIGTSMFAFEGICLMLPIAESMKEPEKFVRVLNYGMLFIGFLFTVIGSLSYLALGNNVETIVFLNLPKTPAVTTLQFFYAISIMLSFPLCVYPAIRITEQTIFGLSTGRSSSLVKWQKNLYRAALTAFLGLVAWAGSTNLDKVVSLVGCFACIPLSFIYPALFHTHVTKSKWVKMGDWMIVVFGFSAMVYTTVILLLIVVYHLTAMGRNWL